MVHGLGGRGGRRQPHLHYAARRAARREDASGIAGVPLPPEGRDRHGGDGPLYALSMFSSGVGEQWEIFPWCMGLHFSPRGEAK